MRTRRGTTTATAKELTADASSSDYVLYFKNVKNLLREISVLVDKHQRNQAKDHKNYGFVGDMGKVADDLMEIREFIGRIP